MVASTKWELLLIFANSSANGSGSRILATSKKELFVAIAYTESQF